MSHSQWSNHISTLPMPFFAWFFSIALKIIKHTVHFTDLSGLLSVSLEEWTLHRSRDFCLFCSLLHLQHLKPYLEYKSALWIFVEWINKLTYIYFLSTCSLPYIMLVAEDPKVNKIAVLTLREVTVCRCEPTLAK